MIRFLIILLFSAQAAQAKYSELKTPTSAPAKTSITEILEVLQPKLSLSAEQQSTVENIWWLKDPSSTSQIQKTEALAWLDEGLDCNGLAQIWARIHLAEDQNRIDAGLANTYKVQLSDLATQLQCAG